MMLHMGVLLHPHITAKTILWPCSHFLTSSSFSIHSSPSALSLMSAPLERWDNNEGKEEKRGGERRGGVEVQDTGRWFQTRSAKPKEVIQESPFHWFYCVFIKQALLK